MGFYDESQSQIIAMLNAVDFSSAFPVSYLGTKGIVITDSWPFDLIQNMLKENDQKMTTPVISVLAASGHDTFRSLGSFLGSGPVTGTMTYATRVEGAYLVSAWADQQMGGAPTTRALGGLIQANAFVNREALAAFRHVRTSASHGAYQEAEQLWRFDVTLEGDALVSYWA